MATSSGKQSYFFRLFAVALGLSLNACSAPDEEKTDREKSCAVRAPTECPDPPPSYQQIAPLFEEKCNTCHTREDPTGPWPLETYSHIVAWRTEIRDEVLYCTMPPKDGEPLTPDERLMLMEWILCGMPE